ncbi:hypothetical protein POVWA2_019050 [Plasmodium ovale wallikeri]|uniref:Uncharacterized protein n=1 Tax=Plasmodium ovale wallikeri TaxID=864142 RepID=A0A1A8YRL3_PLAOA|nr:hypothetical protein POVWA2_019050 [Plasmodium ovale wallikeri]
MRLGQNLCPTFYPPVGLQNWRMRIKKSASPYNGYFTPKTGTYMLGEKQKKKKKNQYTWLCNYEPSCVEPFVVIASTKVVVPYSPPPSFEVTLRGEGKKLKCGAKS